MKMTDEQVNEMEQLIREAQEKMEKVGRMVCSNDDPVAIQTWVSARRIGEKIGEMIHPLYKLRNW